MRHQSIIRVGAAVVGRVGLLGLGGDAQFAVVSGSAFCKYVFEGLGV